MTTPIDFSARPAWVDRWLETIELQIDDDTICEGGVVVFPDHETRIRLQWDLNEDEFTKLLSCVLFGSAILFPSVADRGNIIWSLLKAVDCMPQICSEIVECINNDTEVQNAIIGLTNIDNLSQVSDVAGMVKENDLAAGDNAACDADTWYGGVKELIIRMNRMNEDSLETFEATTNELDFLSEVVGDITGIDETSLDAVLAWIGQLQDNISENYLSQYTLEYEQEITCDLFCMALENCELTPDMLFEYFSGRIGASLTWESLLQDVLNYLTGGEWSGTQIADFMMLSQIMYRKFFGFFFEGTFFKDLSLAVRVGFRSPSDEWEIICTECNPTWEHIFDFTLDDGEWTQHTESVTGGTNGAWFTALGWICTPTAFAGSGLWRTTVNIEKIIDSTVITEVSMVYDLVKGTYSPNGTAIAILLDDAVEVSLLGSGLITGDEQTLSTGTIEIEASDIRLYLASSIRNTASYSGTGSIKSVTLKGNGENPFT